MGAISFAFHPRRLLSDQKDHHVWLVTCHRPQEEPQHSAPSSHGLTSVEKVASEGYRQVIALSRRFCTSYQWSFGSPKEFYRMGQSQSVAGLILECSAKSFDLDALSLEYPSDYGGFVG